MALTTQTLTVTENPSVEDLLGLDAELDLHPAAGGRVVLLPYQGVDEDGRPAGERIALIVDDADDVADGAVVTTEVVLDPAGLTTAHRWLTVALLAEQTAADVDLSHVMDEAALDRGRELDLAFADLAGRRVLCVETIDQLGYDSRATLSLDEARQLHVSLTAALILWETHDASEIESVESIEGYEPGEEGECEGCGTPLPGGGWCPACEAAERGAQPPDAISETDKTGEYERTTEMSDTATTNPAWNGSCLNCGTAIPTGSDWCDQHRPADVDDEPHDPRDHD